MFTVAFQALAIFAVSWTIWRVLKARRSNNSLNNIPGPPGKSIWTGSFSELFNLDGWAYHQEMTRKYGGAFRVKALLGENQLFIFDPKAMHYIFVKDQNAYEENPYIIAFNKLVFGEGLLSTLGDQHRKQRKMLNPVFSIAHMREMLLIFYDVSYKVCLTAKVKDGPQEVIMTWMTRTALELIGQSGLGYSFDPLTEDGKQHPYSKAAKQLIPSMFKLNMVVAYLLLPLSKIGPAKFRRFMIDITPWKDLHAVRDIIDVLHNTSVEIYESKKKALEDGDEALANQIGRGKDIMSILMRANMTASKEEGLTREELLGQMTALIFAAMDTTSSALARILYLLATNQDVQDKLRKEIAEARENASGELSYDELVSLPYLDSICRETLRLHPPVPIVRRSTAEDTVLPLSTPIIGVDGKEMHEIAIPKDTNISIGIMASNRNPEIWGPDADEWKPDRWMNPLPESVIAAHLPGIYSHLLTFIGGSRACIGFKFSQLEMKVVLMLLIESFRFSPSKEKIFWQMAGITTPVVVGSDNKAPQLPLIIERVSK
ncbi:cytochrome P450 [Pholiota conissans]|uniref:Cytochrome P450 n=1 Tax=Pholiota conissans TaxID=109636 RepID=A0A9P5Z4U8_9AGAR|nr:cytochrome P450 [Pholiota conissans]